MRVQPCKRWVIVYDHDSQPVDGTLYIHQAKAKEEQAKLKRVEKYRVEQISLMDTEAMDYVMNKLSEL